MVNKDKLSVAGPEFSKMILGLWRLPDVDVNSIDEILKTALDQGITTIDQADIYGNYKSQEYFGRLLKAQPRLRNEIQIVSKAGIHLPGSKFSKSGIGFYDTSKKHIIESVNTTLQQLNTDYLDVLLIHRPDPLMDPQEVNDTFNTLKQQGKVLYFGVSNFTPSQFDMLQQRIDLPLITNQVEFSVLHLNPLFDGTFDHCMRHNFSPMIWSPLAGGRLFTENSEQINRITAVLNSVSKNYDNASIDQLALSWILQHPAKPFIITGTLKNDRIKATAYSEQIKLSSEHWFEILVAAQGHPVP